MPALPGQLSVNKAACLQADTRGVLPDVRQERRQTGRSSVNKLTDVWFGRTEKADTALVSLPDARTPSMTLYSDSVWQFRV